MKCDGIKIIWYGIKHYFPSDFEYYLRASTIIISIKKNMSQLHSAHGGGGQQYLERGSREGPLWIEEEVKEQSIGTMEEMMCDDDGLSNPGHYYVICDM